MFGGICDTACLAHKFIDAAVAANINQTADLFVSSFRTHRQTEVCLLYAHMRFGEMIVCESSCNPMHLAYASSAQATACCIKPTLHYAVNLGEGTADNGRVSGAAVGQYSLAD